MKCSFPIATAHLLDSATVGIGAWRKHVLPSLERDKRGYVTRESLERRLGYEITPAMFVAADGKREPARAWQRQYNEGRRRDRP